MRTTMFRLCASLLMCMAGCEATHGDHPVSAEPDAGPSGAGGDGAIDAPHDSGAADTSPDRDDQSNTSSIDLPVPPGATGVELARLSDATPAWLFRQTISPEEHASGLLRTASNASELVVAHFYNEEGQLLDTRFVSDCKAPRAASPRVLEVPGTYGTIQAGIDAAEPGDTVLVAPGIYREHLVLHTGVRLVGSGASLTVLDGAGEGVNLIDFTDANDVVVSGFTLRNVGQAEGCARPDDVLACSGNWYSAAVYADGHSVVDDSDPCNDASILLTGNVFVNNSVGVMLYFQPYAVVRNNVFVDNRAGFVANHHGGATALVAHNVFFDNAEALSVSSSYLDTMNNVFVGNTTVLHQEYVQQGRVRCNVLFNNQVLGERIMLGQDGNVELDPALRDVAHFDFRLAEDSLALSAGCWGQDDEGTREAGAYGEMAGPVTGLAPNEEAE